MGVFPEAKHPRVIWIGMSEESEKVKELADKIECDAAKEGFREEEGEFSPHLTIGRIKEKIEVDILSKFLAEHEKEDFGSFRVENVSLMKSTLRRSGPTYERIGKASLG
jgi:2'-5' RNA ligase